MYSNGSEKHKHGLNDYSSHNYYIPYMDTNARKTIVKNIENRNYRMYKMNEKCDKLKPQLEQYSNIHNNNKGLNRIYNIISIQIVSTTS